MIGPLARVLRVAYVRKKLKQEVGSKARKASERSCSTRWRFVSLLELSLVVASVGLRSHPFGLRFAHRALHTASRRKGPSERH